MAKKRPMNINSAPHIRSRELKLTDFIVHPLSLEREKGSGAMLLTLST
jgi:hypothetical protein